MTSSFSLPLPVKLPDFLREPDPEYDWLVPGLLEKTDRLILTGGEGKGKSTFLRQFCMQVAAGVHPFTHEPIETHRVLFVDLENSRAQARRKFAQMADTAGVVPASLEIACMPSGLDLGRPDYRLALTELLNSTWPELLVIGPMYKMAQRLEMEPESAALAYSLDQWRVTYGCAIAMESHQPHQTVADGKKYRPERPYGSSLWLRWPEFGVCLEDDGRLRHWRGAREERNWPVKLTYGEEWPWVVDEDEGACIICGNRLSVSRQKYCSDRCKNIAKQREYRARARA